MTRESIIAALKRVSLTAWVTGSLVALATLFLLWVMNPNGVLFTTTTPTGGDLGAHVWGPAFIRDELLPNFRLTGWTPDWYAGFPAYHFYMVVPMLFIVAVNVGLVLPLAVPLVMALAAASVVLVQRRPQAWAPLLALALALMVLIWPVHYGLAFKFVTMIGLITMPLAGWLMARLAGLPFPAPALMSAATLAFIFDRSFNIFGGNLMSTMAGEFAFVLATTLCLVYLGLLIRGLETQKGRTWAALTLALVGLCHLLVALFAVTATAVALVVYPGWKRLRWVITTGALAGLLSAFWVLPFWWQRNHLNDMAWDKLPRFRSYLWDRSDLAADFLTNDPPLQLVLVLAGIGAITSLIFRRRLGLVLAGSIGVLALAFIHLPPGRLYNGRILPAYYLSAYLLAALGVAEMLRLAGRGLDGLLAKRQQPGTILVAVGSIAATLGLIVALGMPLRALPLGNMDGNTYRWMGLETQQFNLGRAWVNWNFAGYEGRTGDANGGGWDEHRALISTMEEVADQHGCGRLMWEYSSDLVRYGTPMALMLMPHWTDGCVGSMEGLYFEAATTTPYHFMMQSELSVGPSRAQRGLPYQSFNINDGVDHLQQYGVRYYAAESQRPVEAARNHPDLIEVATTGPWTIFLVADSALVEPMTLEPAVWSDVTHETWLDSAADVFVEGRAATVRTVNGPLSWQRITAETPPQQRPLEPITVSNIEVGTDQISFTVDQIGVPVMVKISYFPNWEATGADGPWRATPNLMVVIPTEKNVTLTYGRTGIDKFSGFLTLLGMVLLIVMWRRPEPELEPLPPTKADKKLDQWVEERRRPSPETETDDENPEPPEPRE